MTVFLKWQNGISPKNTPQLVQTEYEGKSGYMPWYKTSTLDRRWEKYVCQEMAEREIDDY